MVRKKQSRAPSRAKPRLPSESFSCNVDEEERKENLERRLEDYNRKVNEIIKQMEMDKVDILDSITNLYFINEKNTPVSVNNMLWKDFLQQNDPSTFKKPTIRQSLASIINAAETQLAAGTTKTVRKGKKKVFEETPVRRSTRKRTKETSNSENVPPTNSIRGTRGKKAQDSFSTPLNSSSVPLAQLMVTPKFDPRTPLPPSTLRKAKPGEVIMSMKGSPVQFGSKEWLDGLTKGDQLDDDTKQDLKDFYDKVGQLLQV